MPRLLILWFSVILSSAWCADQTYAFGYNTADARIFKGNDNQAYYYLAGSVYDITADEWEHYPGGLAVLKKIGGVYNLNLIIKDHLTNSRAILQPGTDNCSGSMTYEAQYDYYPYGKVLRKVENPRSRFQSTDHETDEETGYNNRNARWYDDESFQFLQTDPMGSKYPSFSPYHYVARNPIRLTDPSGKWIPGYDDNGLTLTAEEGDNRESLVKFWGNEENASKFISNYNTLDFDKLTKGSILRVDHKAFNDAFRHSSENKGEYTDMSIIKQYYSPNSTAATQQSYVENRDNFFNYNCFYFSILGTKNFPITNYKDDEKDCRELAPEETAKILNMHYKGINPLAATPLKAVITFGQQHMSVYFGKSQDGTIYTLTKNNWADPPYVETLNNQNNNSLYRFGGVRYMEGTKKYTSGWYELDR
jgi:RHS repeat-associated protein